METKATAGMYHDFNGLSQLKTKARNDESAALQEVAQQFESLFLGMMLKSMRSASLAEGIMDSDQSEFYQEMYDQQIATDLGQKGSLGLSDLIVRQLGGSAVDVQDGMNSSNDTTNTSAEGVNQQLQKLKQKGDQQIWSAAQLNMLNTPTSLD